MQDIDAWLAEAGPAVAESVAVLFEQHLPTLSDRDKVALPCLLFQLTT